MRNMSFSLTTDQMERREKDITRRLGWRFLRPGDVFCAVEKAMGLKRGEKVKRIGLCRVVSVGLQPLGAIDAADVLREGFPGYSPVQFVAMFCRMSRGVTPETEVNRIEFEPLY